MNKKLPNIFKTPDKVTTNNKKAYYSFVNNKEKPIDEVTNQKVDTDNFYIYFNKRVDIELVDGNIINTKILSKIDNRILIENGSYLDVSKIKNIK